MFKNLVRVGLLSTVVLATFTSCEEEQQFTNEKLDAKRVEVQVLNSELAKVRDYVHCQRQGKTISNLYAIGSVLSGHDAIKMGDGTGVSLISALAVAHNITGGK